MADQLAVVAADDDRGPLLVDLLEQADDLEGQLRVEVAGGLVGQDDLGGVDDGPRYGYALLLPVGEPRREIPHLLMEVDQPKGVENPPPDFLALLPDDLEGDGHVVEDRPLEKKPEVLEDDAHALPEPVDLPVRDLQEIDAVDDDLPLGRQELAEYDLEQRRLAGAARPGDEVEIAALDLEGDVGKGPVGGLILLRDVKELDH